MWLYLKIKGFKYKKLHIMLVIMGIMIVSFNVMGYEILFHAEPWFEFFPVSPFGILLGCTEFAVLIWTFEVISDWQKTSRILKVLLLILIPVFSFLSFSGINSYLGTLATADISKVNEVKIRTSNNEEYLNVLTRNVESFDKQITEITIRIRSLNNKINEKNNQIRDIDERESARKLKVLDCEKVADCASTIKAFREQKESLKLDIESLNRNRNRSENRLVKLESRLDINQQKINELKLSDLNEKNKHADVESGFDIKKAVYEKIVLNVTSFIGYEPSNPFEFFVGFVSFVIYPVYFILNLFLALNSPQNIKIREEKSKEKKQLLSIRNKVLEQIAKYLKLRLRRNKKSTTIILSEKIKQHRNRKSKRELAYKKLIRYFCVWARRRTKVKEVKIETIKEIEVIVEKEVEKYIDVVREVEVEKEIEKIIEVEIEVEKIVEVIKEVPIEFRVEVPVEVDKLVKVPTEVPIYIERIKKIPEPFFVKDPQVLLHERLIFIPENATAKEIEEILNAQSRLNDDARNSEASVSSSSQNERRENSNSNGSQSKEGGEGEAA
ncbi:hypothetical protein VXS05_19385 [Photobacterium toruni]|uniref:hypothetical protein n=1 Tax=Photobacterium toruni TaxID=1935446 RepID=UPI002E193A32|nr:hypothetical protein [Photobacterium toruni]